MTSWGRVGKQTLAVDRDEILKEAGDIAGSLVTFPCLVNKEEGCRAKKEGDERHGGQKKLPSRWDRNRVPQLSVIGWDPNHILDRVSE